MPGAPEDRPGKGRLRRLREARLLDLGALVYELHRQAKRAPELLQRKAGELSAVDDQVRESGEGVGACPSCDAETQPGQLVCTNCGTRLALGRRRAGMNVAAVAAMAAVALLGAGAAGFALSELTSDDGSGDEAAVAERPEQAAPPVAGEGEPRKARREEALADATPREPRRSLLLDWPHGLTAHTVVLVTTSDRPAALRLARQAARSGIEAGMLRSDDYNLGAGLWIVFAGRFDTPEGAARQARDLQERFPGAYPQRVEPAG